MAENLLTVSNLVTSFKTDLGTFKAVDHLSFAIAEGETLGLVGESGCGKSVTSLSILRLIESPPGSIESGRIEFDGKNLPDLSEEEMRKIRGNQISMIFQEPMTSLNPVFTIGDQIAEVYRIHEKMTKKDSLEKAKEMLELVKIPSPELRVHEYPHQLSGGMRQRVMIAIALACRPKLLIADEPTTALDVTIQAQILNLMNQLQSELNMAILLITHDLGVVAEVCDKVVVMYAGEAVESGLAEEIFTRPLHPYTQGLLKSVPKLGQKVQSLATIEGMVPSLTNIPKGCRFNDRCPYAKPVCKEQPPKPFQKSKTHAVSCWLHDEGVPLS